jgi:hypothetical protein
MAAEKVYTLLRSPVECTLAFDPFNFAGACGLLMECGELLSLTYYIFPVIGVLKGRDPLLNLVLDDCKEFIRGV